MIFFPDETIDNFALTAWMISEQTIFGEVDAAFFRAKASTSHRLSGTLSILKSSIPIPRSTSFQLKGVDTVAPRSWANRIY
jgi:hypothetical protein